MIAHRSLRADDIDDIIVDIGTRVRHEGTSACLVTAIHASRCEAAALAVSILLITGQSR